ncbi:MAG: hypothetical protein LWW93_15790 [Hyphomicrobiales bacterium]|nr:hypothetical protein [Hyphomicrobiales bacterium]
MRVLLVAEISRLRPWMRDFAADLTARGFSVALRTVDGDPPSGALRLLFEAERLLLGAGRFGGPEALTAEAIAPPPGPDFTAEAVIDLTREPSSSDDGPAFVFALAFDGATGEDALFSALTRGGGATVEIFDPRTGEIHERARPSLECAAGLIAAAATIGARAGAALTARLAAAQAGRVRPRLIGQRLRRVPCPPADATRFPSALAHRLARHLYRLVCHTPHWRIGWRLHDGPGLFDVGRFEAPRFKPLRETGLRFFADPFPISWRGEHHVFVEDFDHRRGKGTIAALRFDENGPTGEVATALEEPWHLSYPSPILHDGELYLAPEATQNRELALYRCVAFPDRWERAATLLSDVVVSDVSIVRRGETWWMFSTIEDGRGGWSDMLAIHSSPTLFGPWTAHRDLPNLIDAGAARSAGLPFERDGRLFRPVQDCTANYGGGVDLVEVTRLDAEGYEQEVRLRLRSGPAWPGGRLHTINRCGRLEVIDGVAARPKWAALDRLVEPLFAPGGPQ